MNDRIKELAELALKSSMINDAVYRPEGYANGASKNFADKFAELIVQECLFIIDDERKPEMTSRVELWEQIKEHFGVE